METLEELRLPGVARLVAVASGKGGVGKSTVSANLAAALAAGGTRVGLLDADIYGPSQGRLLGVAEGSKPAVKGERLAPLEAHGVRCMSMSFVTSARTPAVWRGPMASGALQQLLMQTDWGELDMLLIDMPPGTGDIQLTLAQRAPLAGSVIVTTPQELALLDARKGIEMFRKVQVPALGVIENMSGHVCPKCGHEEATFGSGGGARVAEEYGVPVLARLPLDARLGALADAGKPVVVAEPGSPASLAFKAAAQALLAAAAPARQPAISIHDD